MGCQDGALNHRWHPIGNPHVNDIDQDRHNRVKEKANFCPPSGPQDNFASYDCVKTGEACQADNPDVNILAVRFEDIVVLENHEGNVINPERMDEAEQILQVVILPCEECIFSSNIIQTWIKLSNLSTIKLIIDVLLESGFDDQRPGGVE